MRESIHHFARLLMKTSGEKLTGMSNILVSCSIGGYIGSLISLMTNGSFRENGNKGEVSTLSKRKIETRHFSGGAFVSQQHLSKEQGNLREWGQISVHDSRLISSQGSVGLRSLSVPTRLRKVFTVLSEDTNRSAHF